MKKSAYSISILCIVLFASCTKNTPELDNTINSGVAIIHAAPNLPAVAPAMAPAFDLVIDGLVSNGARRLSYGLVSSSGGAGNGAAYLPIIEGTRNIKVSADSGRTSVIDASLNFEGNKAYTVVAYDTLPASGAGTLRVARFEDNLTVPAVGSTHVRFFHLAPNAPAVDVTLLRTSVTPNDSVTISNRTYFGASPAATLGNFAPVPGGTYTLRVKLAGTQTLVTSFSLGTNLSANRIVTLAAIGTARNQPLAPLVLRHF